jgi:O-antigen ligase
MLISIGVGMLIMSGITLAEFLIVGQKGGRLSWPYGDLTPGNYLAKVGMPAFCALVALASSAKSKFKIHATILLAFTLCSSVLTGERINLILRIASGLTAMLASVPDWRRPALLILGFFGPLGLALIALPDFHDRYITTFIHHLPVMSHSVFRSIWAGSMEVFFTSPFIGVGPDNYRNLCPEISGNNSLLYCSTHPHNFYIQIAAETGLIGLFLAVVLVISIIRTCFLANRADRNNFLAATCFVVPFGFFFPLQSTSDFFGQWNNTFTWSSVAFSLAVAHQTLGRETYKT